MPVSVRWLVIPREEEVLLAKFGDGYREYMQRTSRLVPRRRGRGTLRLGLALALACGPAGAQVRRPIAPWADRSPHGVRLVSVAPGVRLEVLDWGGSGPPLVFLAGLQDVAHGFDDFAPRFIDRNHVIAITRRGYGASSQPGLGYDLATRVADLRAVLDSLHLARVALVGHSIAGDELTAFAGAYPARVSRLVYLDAAYDHTGVRDLLGANAPWPRMLAKDSASPAAVQAYLHRAFGMHIPQAQLRAIGRYDAAGRLVADVTPGVIDSLVLAGCGHPDYRAVRAPALAIYAVVDSAPQIFPSWAPLDAGGRAAARHFTTILQAWAAAERARLRRDLPAAQVLELHGANHYVFSSHSREVTESMRAFLASDRSELQPVTR
jgi:pimeloyl-ACP methyl ester carboxylesterase